MQANAFFYLVGSFSRCPLSDIFVTFTSDLQSLLVSGAAGRHLPGDASLPRKESLSFPASRPEVTKYVNMP